MFGRGGHDPFEQMRAHMDSMMGGLFDDPFSNAQHADRGANRVQVQEVDEQHDSTGGEQNQPIVEEPDDQPRNQRQARRQQHSHEQRPRPRQQEQQMPFGDLGGFGGFGGFGRDPFASMFNMDMNNMGGNSYCYSSTYSSSSGPDGMIYESSKSTRRGPGGVMESHSSMRDGRSGEERMRIERGLGDRQRTLERARRGGAPEERNEVLKGLNSAEEAAAFDQEWQQAAERGLPNVGMGWGMGRLGNGAGGSRRRVPVQDGTARQQGRLGGADEGRYV